MRNYQKTPFHLVDPSPWPLAVSISALSITAKKSSNTDFWKINLNPVMYTARVETSEIYTQSYDFRSLDNTALATRITTYS